MRATVYSISSINILTRKTNFHFISFIPDQRKKNGFFFRVFFSVFFFFFVFFFKIKTKLRINQIGY